MSYRKVDVNIAVEIITYLNLIVAFSVYRTKPTIKTFNNAHQFFHDVRAPSFSLSPFIPLIIIAISPALHLDVEASI